MHALITEDETLIAMNIEDALRDCGCSSFDFACSVEAAVAAAERHCPDLITADVQLAPGCGIDAVEAICCDRHIPVIFITGTAAEVERRLSDHVIVHKPFAAARIAEAVGLVLGDSARSAAPAPSVGQGSRSSPTHRHPPEP